MAKNISAYLKDLKKKSPEDLVTVAKAVDPANFDVTAILKHMEDSGLFPLLVFENPRNLKGKTSAFPLVTNVFATRQRCAMLCADRGAWADHFLRV